MNELTDVIPWCKLVQHSSFSFLMCLGFVFVQCRRTLTIMTALSNKVVLLLVKENDGHVGTWYPIYYCAK